MKLVFDDLALADLEGIYNRIAKDNPKAAFAVVERLFESVEHLATFPLMGYVGRDAGTGRQVTFPGFRFASSWPRLLIQATVAQYASSS